MWRKGWRKIIMALTKPIPKKMREEMERDPFYHRCCVTGVRRSPHTKIEWHHHFRFRGERVNEKWCILPVSKEIHDRARTREIGEKLDWVMLNRADEETLRRYSKAEDLIAKRDRLNKKHENEINHTLLHADAEAGDTASA